MQLTELFLCPMDGNRALKDKGVSSPLTDRLFVCLLFFFIFYFLTEKNLGEEKLSHTRAKTSRRFQRTYIGFIDCPPKKIVDNETRT